MPQFPFTAIVGQDEMKHALIINVIEPRVGGVMVMGHRGTGKSTTVRALAGVLPEIVRISGDPYNREAIDGDQEAKATQRRTAAARRSRHERIPVPVVDLPLGATEDRVCGTIDIEAALSRGEKRFEPGLLAHANRGFLYIDEVNLLDDHLVDVLLDVAASGQNVVEREGVSVKHPARFVLVGSGNPEEGELRPQLLDRFGLSARIVTVTDIEQRVEIVKRRRAFDADPEAFCAAAEKAQNALSKRIARAQSLICDSEAPDAVIVFAATLCATLGVDGHRGELTLIRAASAHAAWDGRRTVTVDDVRAVAFLSLRHRLRRDPLDPSGSDEKIAAALEGG
jgi:magnesium chelatase subunit I